MPFDRVIFRAHSIERMFERNISDADVKDVIRRNDVIEQYDADYPLPSKLYFGILKSRVLHVVAADNLSEQCTIIITVYEPDLEHWEPGFRKRRVK